MPRGRKNRKKKDEFYPSKLTAWERQGDYGYYISGVLCLSYEFLLELIEGYEDGDPDIVDDYDDRYARVGITLNESEYDNCDFMGSAKIVEQKKKKSRGRGGKRSRR